MINIDVFNPQTAVCPFCRKYITANIDIYKSIIADVHKTALKKVLSGTANRLRCPLCGEEFYYEHDFEIISSEKSYAIMSLPGTDTPTKQIKTALFNILGKNSFKLRCVHEFIHVIEKARIFEYGLDDRALELVKYKYIASNCSLQYGHKIILTGTTPNALKFTIYNGYDKAIARHNIGIDAYSTECAKLEKEIISAKPLKWKEISLAWAEKHTKEK